MKKIQIFSAEILKIFRLAENILFCVFLHLFHRGEKLNLVNRCCKREIYKKKKRYGLTPTFINLGDKE
ncbi:MAG: hypothetical protein CMO98_00385 [Woeseia sp.]|nr:hypothetical protein [Woeseia sp.]|tara:strand:- start:173 stop:376 length:204 start_codon:yes stop_codon:yes gene_type:complete